jgi:hypothetical protein
LLDKKGRAVPALPVHIIDRYLPPKKASRLAEPPDDESRPTRSKALIALIALVLLVIAAVYLVQALREESEREDCLMSGRRNCAPIEIPTNTR